MKRRMYCVRDNKTSFWTPHEGYSDPAAVRDFQELVNKNELIRTHPGDFDLYYIGLFDGKTGQFEPVSPIEFIVSASSLVYGGAEIEKS